MQRSKNEGLSQNIGGWKQKTSLYGLVLRPERKTGFEPATFSLASIIGLAWQEHAEDSNSDMFSASLPKKQNNMENVVFCI
jgi:hypothetical protein